MSKAVSGLQEIVSNGDRHPQPDEIRRQLRNVLASSVFHGSKRCQQFLEYVCERSLAGAGSTLKERTIAVEVFGRQPQIDLGEDTIVRVGAREVRKRLAQYYVTPEGAAAEIRIDLPSGCYAPEFRYVTAAPEKEPVPTPPAVEPRRKTNRKVILAVAALAAAAAAFAAIRLTAPSPNMEAFEGFWKPVFRAQEPLLIAMAHPIVYHPSGRALRLSEKNLPAQEIPLQRAIQVAPGELNGGDMVPVFNQYVGFGDMIAANEVSAMLARKGRTVRVRMASGVEFADLRNTQTFLIGSVTNRWTMQLQQGWRFRVNWTPGTRTEFIDTQATSKAAGGGHWAVVASDDGSTPDDYILICRVFSKSTGGLILAAAGLKQFGTEAAGRLLADPEQLGAILRKLPKGWEGKNLQVVLHAPVIGNTPAQPDVVASYVW